MMLVAKNAIYDLRAAKAIQVLSKGLRIDYDPEHLIPIVFPDDIELSELEIELLIDYIVENKDKKVKVKLEELLEEIKAKAEEIKKQEKKEEKQKKEEKK